MNKLKKTLGSAPKFKFVFASSARESLIFGRGSFKRAETTLAE